MTAATSGILAVYLSSRAAVSGGMTAGAAATGSCGSAPIGSLSFADVLRRRGWMSSRLIISFSVVGLICSSSAARFCTPPACSSVDSIRRFSKSDVTSLNEMPSGGSTNCGTWNSGALRT